MQPGSRGRFQDALEVLHRHGVEFMVVGGVAAVLEGAPVVTFDLDILVPSQATAMPRLLAALSELEALYRDPIGRRIEPSAERLLGARLSLLKTRCGDLDVLTQIGRGRHYEDLVPRSHTVLLGEMAVRVLELEAVIETKEEAGRPKDRMMLFDLKETLRLKKR